MGRRRMGPSNSRATNGQSAGQAPVLSSRRMCSPLHVQRAMDMYTHRMTLCMPKPSFAVCVPATELDGIGGPVKHRRRQPMLLA